MLRGMGMVHQSCSPSIQEASRQKLEVDPHSESQVIQDYTARPGEA